MYFMYIYRILYIREIHLIHVRFIRESGVLLLHIMSTENKYNKKVQHFPNGFPEKYGKSGKKGSFYPQPHKRVRIGAKTRGFASPPPHRRKNNPRPDSNSGGPKSGTLKVYPERFESPLQAFVNPLGTTLKCCKTAPAGKGFICL